jgi:Cytochrome P460
MKPLHLKAIMIVAAFLFVISITFAAQDRFTLKAPNGIAFSEFKGYDTWQVIAPSQTDDGIKAITGNPTMIKAYNDGIPANGKPVPDGAMMAKIDWAKKPNTASPYNVNVPDTLKSVSLMIKDAKRFPDTNGWGYAQFNYDATSNTFKPYGSDGSFAKMCHQCHTRVKARDFVFTSYGPR